MSNQTNLLLNSLKLIVDKLQAEKTHLKNQVEKLTIERKHLVNSNKNLTNQINVLEKVLQQKLSL